MLSIIHKKDYQDFLKLLKRWQTVVADPDCDPQKIENQELWQNLQTVFKDRIITITDTDMNLADASSWISIQAEIQREFRLLQTDWLFFQSSRQVTTRQARQANMLKHLEKLIIYCQSLLAEDAN